MKIKLFIIFISVVSISFIYLSENKLPITESKHKSTTQELPIPVPYVARKNMLPLLSNEQLAFRAVLKEALNSFPTLEQVRSQTKDFHDTPPTLLESSQKLAVVVNSMKQNPTLIPDGLKFYQACAKKNELPTALRAVCLKSLIDWSAKLPTPKTVSLDSYPENIRRVAQSIFSMN